MLHVTHHRIVVFSIVPATNVWPPTIGRKRWFDWRADERWRRRNTWIEAWVWDIPTTRWKLVPF
jgi:hypothetical protein